jgi:hypothetical protein
MELDNLRKRYKRIFCQQWFAKWGIRAILDHWNTIEFLNPYCAKNRKTLGSLGKFALNIKFTFRKVDYYLYYSTSFYEVVIWNIIVI